MNRRKNSGGQAIILVTLALLTMCGMMGLAVDMGWSFFVHKQAQTAADAAALGAVEAGFKRLTAGAGAISAFTCAAGGTDSTHLDCETTAVNCASVTSGSNLNNGCQYALKNGFDWTTSRQNVTMQSNDALTGDLPSTSPGVKNMVYWVTVRTVQTIPQLFSAIWQNNAQGTVSAVATAAIAASIGPGQFYGMNRRGDCTNVNPATGTGGQNCGEDYEGAPGKSNTTACGSGKANLCAPAGIILASNCNGSSTGCDGNAGDGSAMGASVTIMGDGTTNGGVTGTWNNMAGTSLLPCPGAGSGCTYTNAADTFKDPTAPNPQPPLASELPAGSQPISACGYPDGVVPANSTLGANQYYSMDPITHVPNGKQLSFSGTVNFTNATGAGSCPNGGLFTAGASQGSSQFPTYIFYGGMNAGSSNMNMGPGQYVMAGTKTSDQTVVFQEKNASITGTAAGLATGTMWIFTDANYPGLAAQEQLIANTGVSVSSIQNLSQGSLAFKDGSITLQGLIGSANTGSNLPPGLDAYSGITWWQDRRNSDVGYNEAALTAGCPGSGTPCTGDNGTVLVCGSNGDCPDANNSALAAMMTANHVTSTSPGLVMDPGNANIALQGVFYQPRGAWIDFVAGTTGFTCPIGFGGGPNQQCPLQVITGALFEDHGTASLNLAGPTDPIITYKPVLIH